MNLPDRKSSFLFDFFVSILCILAVSNWLCMNLETSNSFSILSYPDFLSLDLRDLLHGSILINLNLCEPSY